MLTIGALVYATSGEFAKYIPEFYKSCFVGDLSRKRKDRPRSIRDFIQGRKNSMLAVIGLS